MMKPLVIVAGILITLIPWMGGGRDPLAVLISVFGLLITAFLLRDIPKPQLAAGLTVRWLTFLWLAWGAASIIWSVNRFQSEIWLLYAVIAVLVFALTTRLDATEKELLRLGYIWVATVVAAYGFYLYFTGDYDRLTSSYYWANPAAAYLAPAALLAGWRWITNRGWLYAIPTVLLGTAFWLTSSRAAALAVLIVVVAACAFGSVRRRALPIVAIAVITFGLGMGGAALRTHFLHHAAVSPSSRFSAAAQGESTSASDRINYLKSTISIWEAHPLLGTGAGTFSTVHPQYQRRVISASSDAHNIVAQALAEQGLVGALILIYLLLSLVLGVGRGIARQPANAVVAAGAAVLLLHFGVDIDDRYPASIALLAMLIGLSYQPGRSRALRNHQRLAVPTLLLVALAISVSAYRSNIFYQHGLIDDSNFQYPLAATAYASAHSGLVYDPDTWTAEGIDYYTLATLAGDTKRYLPLARDRAQAAIARDPKDAQHYFLLGRAYRIGNNLSAAMTAYRQALALDPWNHPDYYLDPAQVLLQQGNTTAAQQLVTRALALYPDSVIANRNADAGIKPTIAELLALQAADRLQHGNTAAATIDLDRALKLDPSNQDVKQLKAHGLSGPTGG